MPDRNRAKDIILEIVRLAGDNIRGKTRLFKAFYIAHLFYAKRAPGYLSDWPIVRMPHGPGIDSADQLIKELVGEGRLAVHTTDVGPYNELQYVATCKQAPPSLSLSAIDAIRDAVDFVEGKTAAELSELTHEFSRSWKAGKDGDELNIYIDLVSDEDYAADRRAFQEMDAVIDSVMKS